MIPDFDEVQALVNHVAEEPSPQIERQQSNDILNEVFTSSAPQNPPQSIDEITLALCIAIARDNMEMVEMLSVKAGANPNRSYHLDDWTPQGVMLAQNLYQQGSTPFFWACSFGRVRMVQFLLEHGADTTIRDSNGKGCLHYACAPHRFWVERTEIWDETVCLCEYPLASPFAYPLIPF